MALPLWGQLEKAQDDTQTIDEAIAEAIANHEADSEAHLGSGESLEQHKAEDIIDHPAGSLLSDKQTMTEIAVSTIFESLDGWTTGGDVSNDDIPGLQFYVEDGFVDDSYIRSNPQTPVNFFSNDFDMLFQIQARYDFAGSGYDGNFGFFGANSITPSGFGFIVDQGALYAYVKNGTENEQSDEISLDLTADHVYRAYLDSGLQEVLFYVDGTLEATLDVPTNGWEDDTGPRMWIGRGSESDGNFVVGILNFSRAL